MAGLELMIFLGILVLFGLIVVYMVYSERKARKLKIQISLSLGFTPIDPDPELIQKITQLYQTIRVNKHSLKEDKYELQNVYYNRLLDGEMYLFDLIDKSGEDNSYTEKQAVAVISPHLNLPVFVIFPKSDFDGAISHLANKAIGWVFSKVGHPLEFPEVPEFGQRFLVSSPDPQATRQFFDQRKLSRLAKSKLFCVYAGGDIFTLSRMDLTAKPLTLESMSQRVNQALNVFSIFLS